MTGVESWEGSSGAPDGTAFQHDDSVRREARSGVSVVLPCLNEEDAIASCILEAHAGLRRLDLDAGEVLVVDNGSVDASAATARAHGARVMRVDPPGYGRALDAGIRAARHDIVVVADADGSYDLTDLAAFIGPLVRREADMVVGNRFAHGSPSWTVMPLTHAWLGNPVLSFLARRATRSAVRDFHCGLRSLRRSDYVAVVQRAHPGMAWASDVILQAHAAGLRLENHPTRLRPDKRVNGTSHLRPVPDALAHLVVIGQHYLHRQRAAPARARSAGGHL